jgi:drug/metabolite transporter (DMT)-like permease
VKRSTKATLALLIVTVSWGWTFVWMEDALTAGKAVSPEGLWPIIALFMVIRFSLAVVTVPFFVKGSIKRFSSSELQGGFVLALLLVLGFLLQLWGLDRVTAPVSAFLTSLYVIFTLLMTTIAARRAPRRGLMVGALLATFGAGFISGPPHVNFALGEGLSVGCAFVFAVHILATDYYTKREDPAALTFLSFLGTALLTLAVLVIATSMNDAVDTETLIAIATDEDFMWPTILSSIFATSLALTLMNFFQRDLPPVRAAILYALEPIWASMVALSIGQTEPTLWLYIGGGALLLGNLVAELFNPDKTVEGLSADS